MPIIERQQTVYLAKCDECGREMEPTVYAREAVTQARTDGWYISTDADVANCPECIAYSSELPEAGE